MFNVPVDFHVYAQGIYCVNQWSCIEWTLQINPEQDTYKTYPGYLFELYLLTRLPLRYTPQHIDSSVGHLIPARKN